VSSRFLASKDKLEKHTTAAVDQRIICIIVYFFGYIFMAVLDIEENYFD